MTAGALVRHDTVEGGVHAVRGTASLRSREGKPR